MGKVKTILRKLVKMIFLVLSGLILAFGLLLIVLQAWDTWRIARHVPEGKPMFTSTSPDNRFTVAAYRSPTIFPRFSISFPGQGGDGPALFILKDNRTDKELQRRHVTYWYIYTDVDWHHKDFVRLAPGDGIIWQLPR